MDRKEGLMKSYYFGCEECGTMVESWSENNTNIISSFKFIMKHTMSCGEEYIRLVNEDSIEAATWDAETDLTLDLMIFEKFLRDTRELFPYSTDWNLAKYQDINKAWIEEQYNNIKASKERDLRYKCIDKLRLKEPNKTDKELEEELKEYYILTNLANHDPYLHISAINDIVLTDHPDIARPFEFVGVFTSGEEYPIHRVKTKEEADEYLEEAKKKLKAYKKDNSNDQKS